MSVNGSNVMKRGKTNPLLYKAVYKNKVSTQVSNIVKGGIENVADIKLKAYVYGNSGAAGFRVTVANKEQEGALFINAKSGFYIIDNSNTFYDDDVPKTDPLMGAKIRCCNVTPTDVNTTLKPRQFYV